jgi:predicted DNA-binding transcriptional regulator AlpA
VIRHNLINNFNERKRGQIMAHDNNGNDENNYLSQRALAKLLGVSVTTVQRLRKEPEFPIRKRFSFSTKGWVKGEVVAWVKSRPEA